MNTANQAAERLLTTITARPITERISMQTICHSQGQSIFTISEMKDDLTGMYDVDILEVNAHNCKPESLLFGENNK